MADSLPLAVSEFWRTIGSVDFTCRGPGGKLHASALAVLPPANLLSDHAEWEDEGSEGPVRVELVAGCGIDQPAIEAAISPGADARLETSEWFVDHLRRTARTACLGIAPDELTTELRALADTCERF